jgi:uncharacterized membrane protein
MRVLAVGAAAAGVQATVRLVVRLRLSAFAAVLAIFWLMIARPSFVLF